jgi:hypothetical protein
MIIPFTAQGGASLCSKAVCSCRLASFLELVSIYRYLKVTFSLVIVIFMDTKYTITWQRVMTLLFNDDLFLMPTSSLLLVPKLGCGYQKTHHSSSKHTQREKYWVSLYLTRSTHTGICSRLHEWQEYVAHNSWGCDNWYLWRMSSLVQRSTQKSNNHLCSTFDKKI